MHDSPLYTGYQKKDDRNLKENYNYNLVDGGICLQTNSLLIYAYIMVSKIRYF